MLKNVKVVLVGTSHSGNIGSAARAMKVMGLSNMVLVAPQCEVDGQTIALAAGASEIAVNASIVSSLSEAVKDCSLVVGSSARIRTLEWPQMTPKECGNELIHEAQRQSVALVFGRERTGLTNEELQACHYHVAIPANPEYSSLNLAMAVQTLCYEVRMAYLEDQKSERTIDLDAEYQYPRHDELERFYQHLAKVLVKTEFIEQDAPNQVIKKIRRLLTRARPEKQEINILRGILTSIEKKLPLEK